MIVPEIAPIITERFGRSYHLTVGRGTTALWLALNAIRIRHGTGSVIIPDIICDTVLHAVLLAGFTPLFGEVTPDRFTLDPAQLPIRGDTRAIIVAHLFGHDADIAAIRHAAPNIPIIEDAVQGLGGKNAAGTPHGAEGDLSIISYDDTKMIGGRGGVVMTDDPDLYAHMCEVAATLFGSTLPDAAPPIEPFCALLSPSAADAFRSQLIGAMPALLRPFDPVHIPRIVEDWRTLDERLRKRERISHLYASGLADLPIILPPLRFTDVIWRYTLTARSPIDAGRIARALQRQNLPGSRLYPPLSQLFGIRTRSGQLENRLINLWVADIDPDAVIHTIQGLHLR